MPVKIVFMFAHQGYKWSEDHYALSFTRPQDASAAALNLAIQRAACLGVGPVLREIRLSSVPANGLVEDVYFTSDLSGSFPPGFDLTTPAYAAPSFTAVLVRISSPTGLHRNLYLAGAPTGLFTGELADDNFLFYAAVPYWYSLLTAYMGQLTSGQFGWLTRTGATYVQATGIVQQVGPPAAIGIVTQAPLPGVVAGGQVLVKGWRRMNVRTLGPLTGVYTVMSVVIAPGPPETWTYYLLNTSTVSPTNFFTLGKIAPLALTPTVYNEWVAEQSVQRKRANPVAGRRGRAPIKG